MMESHEKVDMFVANKGRLPEAYPQNVRRGNAIKTCRLAGRRADARLSSTVDYFRRSPSP